MTKEEALKDTLKRVLILMQIFKYNVEELRASDTIKEWARVAKDNKNKNFLDLRVAAVDQLNSMNAFLFKMKKSMRPETFNAIMTTLTSEQVREIDVLLNELTELSENAIERITVQVKDAKTRAGIPLNNPNEENGR